MATRTAVVLSGGGAKGAYAIGVMRALFTGASEATGYRPIDPGVFTGTSVGAYSATILASQPGAPAEVALDRLERLWRRRIADRPDSCGNGVYRLRGLPAQELEPQCFVPTPARLATLLSDTVYFGGELAGTAASILRSKLPLPSRLLQAVDAGIFFDDRPLRSLLAETVDFSALERSSKELMVVASRWCEATPRIFPADELVARRRIEPILASMAIPGVFPQVWIDGAPYVDGGLSMNTPIKPAIRAGADVIHVIYLDPKVADAEVASDGTFDTLARIFAVLSAEQLKADLRTADDVNRGLELLRRAERADRLGRLRTERIDEYAVEGIEGAEKIDRTREEPLPDLDSGVIRGLAKIAVQRTAARPKDRRRQLEIHSYRPKGGLARGSDLLNFGIDHLDALIRQGYRDAVEHDCMECECVFPHSDVRGGKRAAKFRAVVGDHPRGARRAERRKDVRS